MVASWAGEAVSRSRFRTIHHRVSRKATADRVCPVCVPAPPVSSPSQRTAPHRLTATSHEGSRGGKCTPSHRGRLRRSAPLGHDSVNTSTRCDGRCISRVAPRHLRSSLGRCGRMSVPAGRCGAPAAALRRAVVGPGADHASGVAKSLSTPNSTHSTTSLYFLKHKIIYQPQSSSYLIPPAPALSSPGLSGVYAQVRVRHRKESRHKLP